MEGEPLVLELLGHKAQLIHGEMEDRAVYQVHPQTGVTIAASWLSIPNHRLNILRQQASLLTYVNPLGFIPP
jgi:hypothetical protein